MDNVSLSTLANFAEIIGGISILTGLVFGIVQLRYYRRQQQASWAEWFEWLADQAKKTKTANEPAHIRFRNWKR